MFDVGDELWSAVTVVHPHGRLGDYPGWYVAWREGGVHVSAPWTSTRGRPTACAGSSQRRTATSYAVRQHGYARWRCRDTNVPSARAAERLGFEPYATQLAVRRGSSAA